MTAAVCERIWSSGSRSIRGFATMIGLSFGASRSRTQFLSSAHYWMTIGRVIRAANQRTGGDVEKTFPACDVAVTTELLRRNVFNDRQMFRSRAQILAHGQNFTAHLAQIVHRLKEFRLFFAQAEHHAALGDNTSCEFLRPAQHSQGRAILRARAYHWC